nr:hypothetical protein [Nostoc sp. SerVER01]
MYDRTHSSTTGDASAGYAYAFASSGTTFASLDTTFASSGTTFAISAIAFTSLIVFIPKQGTDINK